MELIGNIPHHDTFILSETKNELTYINNHIRQSNINIQQMK